MSDKNLPCRVPRLSEMEWEIMKPLWQHGPMAARNIYDEVPDRYGWAYKTVKTMLARLVKGTVVLWRLAFRHHHGVNAPPARCAGCTSS